MGKKFSFTENERFLRGLLFISTGAFLLLRYAANGNGSLGNFFAVAAWVTALVALGALVLFLWSVYQRQV